MINRLNNTYSGILDDSDTCRLEILYFIYYIVYVNNNILIWVLMMKYVCNTFFIFVILILNYVNYNLTLCSHTHTYIYNEIVDNPYY